MPFVKEFLLPLSEKKPEDAKNILHIMFVRTYLKFKLKPKHTI